MEEAQQFAEGSTRRSNAGREARPTRLTELVDALGTGCGLANGSCVILLGETKRLRIDEEYRFIEWHWLAKQKPT